MSASSRALNALAHAGQVASARARPSARGAGRGSRTSARGGARGWAWLLALLLALQGFAWTTHAASHAVPAAACAATAAADHVGDPHCSGGACVTCHALSLFDSAPPAGHAPPALAVPAPAPAAGEVLPLPRRSLPWAQSRAPPLPA